MLDDLSTHTGVYARGGPQTLDAHNVTLQNHLDRSHADARGVKKVKQHQPEEKQWGVSTNVVQPRATSGRDWH